VEPTSSINNVSIFLYNNFYLKSWSSGTSLHRIVIIYATSFSFQVKTCSINDIFFICYFLLLNERKSKQYLQNVFNVASIITNSKYCILSKSFLFLFYGRHKKLFNGSNKQVLFFITTFKNNNLNRLKKLCFFKYRLKRPYSKY